MYSTLAVLELTIGAKSTFSVDQSAGGTPPDYADAVPVDYTGGSISCEVIRRYTETTLFTPPVAFTDITLGEAEVSISGANATMLPAGRRSLLIVTWTNAAGEIEKSRMLINGVL